MLDEQSLCLADNLRIKSPLVSIVIPAYNNEPYISECLDSVLNQTYKNWEAIVVYSPSPDQTYYEILKFCNRDPRFRIVKVPKSTCAIARNVGFGRCAGKYVAFLDADDWWDTRKLKIMVCAMERAKDARWGSHYLVTHREHGIIYGRCHPGDSWEIVGISTVMFRKTYLETIRKRWGYIFYPPMPKGDDGDLCLRILNDPSVCIPFHLGHWRWNPSGLTANTSLSESLLMTLWVAYRNRAYSVLPYYFWNLALKGASELLRCDLVQLKRKVVGRWHNILYSQVIEE